MNSGTQKSRRRLCGAIYPRPLSRSPSPSRAREQVRPRERGRLRCAAQQVLGRTGWVWCGCWYILNSLSQKIPARRPHQSPHTCGTSKNLSRARARARLWCDSPSTHTCKHEWIRLQRVGPHRTYSAATLGPRSARCTPSRSHYMATDALAAAMRLAAPMLKHLHRPQPCCSPFSFRTACR